VTGVQTCALPIYTCPKQQRERDATPECRSGATKMHVDSRLLRTLVDGRNFAILHSASRSSATRL
jgi:hypothetical protein